MRLVWMALGWLAIAVGILALILPLVPTTPFLVLATICFARSSPRIHDWLVWHPRLGPPIRDWRDHGAIGRGVKVSGVLGFLAAPTLSFAFGLQSWIVAGQLALALAAIAFIVTRPVAPGPAE